jgi:hypothetical protein
MKKAVVLIPLLFLAAMTGRAQNSVSLTWSYDLPDVNYPIYSANGTTPLAGAAGSNGGTGFVLQLGYFSLASGTTASTLFQGTWVPVFGPGTSNSLFSNAGMGEFTNQSSTSGTDDQFDFSGVVTSATASTEIGIPSAGQIMSIRYYNSNSLATATLWGTVSDASWLWITPNNPPPTGMSFSMLDPDTVYQGGVSQAETNIPEPGTLTMLLGAMTAGGALTLRRRRR